MSLDVYLYGEPQEVKCVCDHCENEHTRVESECHYSANITHNLNRMADATGIYYAVWRPDEEITRAHQLIPFLRSGIQTLESSPETFKRFDAANGWGTYVRFLPWLRNYLQACEEHPDAYVRVSR